MMTSGAGNPPWSPMEHEDESPAMLEAPHPSEARRTRVENASAGDGGGGTAPRGAEGSALDTRAPETRGPDTRGSEGLTRESERSVAAKSAEKPAADKLAEKPAPAKKKRPQKGPGSNPNNVRKLRIERMMSKAELARRANLSVLTIDRVEKGYGCRMDTKRKILEALGLSLGDRVRVFGEEE